MIVMVRVVAGKHAFYARPDYFSRNVTNTLAKGEGGLL
jgi:RNA processing factor Prp31